MSKRNENMKVSNMKSDLGGILMRMRHKTLANKQVWKKSSRRELSVGNLPAILKSLKPSSVKKPGKGKGRSFPSPFSSHHKHLSRLENGGK